MSLVDIAGGSPICSRQVTLRQAQDLLDERNVLLPAEAETAEPVVGECHLQCELYHGDLRVV